MNLSKGKLTVACILISFAFFPCSGNNSTDGGLLWKITGNGLKEPSYLFGTNHGMSIDFVDSIPGFWDAFNSAKQLAVEYDIAKYKHLDSVHVFLPKDTTYLELINSSDRAVLDSVLLIYSHVTSKEMRLRPGYLMTQLEMSMLKKASSEWEKENPYLRVVNFYKNIDTRLQHFANFRSYPIIGLDSKEELNRLGLNDFSCMFKSNYLADQAKEMVQYIKDIPKDSLIEINHKSMEAYYNQNLKSVYKWATHYRLNDKKANEVTYIMTAVRNLSWLDKILASIRKQSTFIAVGVAHLPGEKGLINLLRKEGYTVNPVIRKRQ